MFVVESRRFSDPLSIWCKRIARKIGKPGVNRLLCRARHLALSDRPFANFATALAEERGKLKLIR